MKQFFFAALAAATAVCSSCTDQDETLHDSLVSMQVSVSGEGISRAIHQGTSFAEGAELGVSLFAADGKPYEGMGAGYVNVPYTSQFLTGGGKDMVWNSTTPIRLSPTSGKAVAYYPYSASVTDIHSIPIDVTKSQTDYMYSGWTEGISASRPQAQFTLHHALTAIDVSIRRDGYEGEGKVTAISVVSPQLATSATLDAATGSLSGVAGANQPVPARIGTPFTISPNPSSTSILTVPTGVQGGLTVRVTMDGKNFTVPVQTPEALTQGKLYTVSLLAKADENLQLGTDCYVVKVKIPSDGFTFCSNVYDFSGAIDWGDGTIDRYPSKTHNPSHYYKKAGEFTVTAKGECTRLSYKGSDLTTSASCLTEIVYIGESLGLTSMEAAFLGCSSLMTLRKGIFDGLGKVDNFKMTFENCSSLQSIPAGLFDNCRKVTNFNSTFERCSSLRSIPAGLFDWCWNVEYFSYTFAFCEGLISIPQGLFDNNRQVTSFGATFIGSGLQSIPQGLFDNNRQVTCFQDTFGGCYDLTSIPAGLFDSCPLADNFGGTFSDCSSLTSIPAGLFDKNTQATCFGGVYDYDGVEEYTEGTFERCRSLRSIPAGLFRNNTLVTHFSCTFANCDALTSIPKGLFDNNTQVTHFGVTFEFCDNLASIPAGLFDKNTQVKEFWGTFRGCPALNNIPARLFDNCPSVTDFSNLFCWCSSLTSIPAGLFDNCPLVKSFDATFLSCNLQSIPHGLFDNNRQVQIFWGTFSENSGMKGESPYTMIDGKKVHIYERENYPNHFTKPSDIQGCFYQCSGMTDYKNMTPICKREPRR